ncbi:uncharacterized protein LOC111605724 [Drosophila hydei]|uniref:Uncharacterized protein LOC111605724 n=1 Tax=Drosophila hydei TaxID=7224 RepID=A0A6J1ML78_DROHY|nr:uncharacterized protein LOC111605724 [Drosophila hydei]
MNNQTWLWQLVVIALLAASQAKQRPFTIQIKNFTCWPTEPSLFTDLSCSSSKKRGAATMSARFSLSQALEQFSLMVDFDIIKKDNSKMNIQHTKIDGCQYLTSACKHKFQGGIFETVLKVSNLPRGCPFQANKVYEVRNYTITLERIPMALPSLTYHVKIKFFRLKQTIGDALLVASAMY